VLHVQSDSQTLFVRFFGSPQVESWYGVLNCVFDTFKDTHRLAIKYFFLELLLSAYDALNLQSGISQPSPLRVLCNCLHLPLSGLLLR